MSPRPGPAAIRLVPLGGLGEIGMNCLAIEQDDGILVVDCGTAFPHDDVGVDVIHADFSWLIAERERVVGVFLTHGHEDHVGALPYLLRVLDVPVWGPPHALANARRRLDEHDLRPDEVTLHPAVAGQVYEVGPFLVEPVRVSHSIVEASALRIVTAAGTVVHTGDFNFDPDPPDGESTDEARLRELGDAGVALLLSDSTNIDVPERTGSERAVAACLEELIAKAPGRVYLAMFASNVQRLMSIGTLARHLGRKICLLGRSLNTQVDIATHLGRLRWPSDLLVSPDHSRELPRERMLALVGGSQAEASSALVRLARGQHPLLSVERGDTVIFSSRIIPGNERPVHALECDLLRLGATVHTRRTCPEVHTSGHAGRSELTRMLELVRPRAFVPVHGTLHHLLRHAELARSLGIDPVEVMENGQTLRLGDDGLTRDAPVPSGRVHVALGGEVLTSSALGKRVELARGGVLHVAVVLDARGEVVRGPEVTALGVPVLGDDPLTLRIIAKEAAHALQRSRRPAGGELTELVRRAARHAALELCGYRPLVEVSLLTLDDP